MQNSLRRLYSAHYKVIMDQNSVLILLKDGIRHRHSRVRKPNDNAHVERFNRTIQEEFLDHLPRDVSFINEKLPEYLVYYNTKRLHLGIGLKTPQDILLKRFQAIG